MTAACGGPGERPGERENESVPNYVIALVFVLA
jgi:hypothetical protein